MIETLQARVPVTLYQLSDALGLGYGRLLRWRKRVCAQQPPLRRPGPGKVEALPLKALQEEIDALRRGPCRSAGSGALIHKHEREISRRELGQMIQERHSQKRREHRQGYRRIHWKTPNLCWAIDGTELNKDENGGRLFSVEVEDLCARYKLEPLVTATTDGAAIAKHLEWLFRRHGAPLFLKKDNGSPFNNEEIDAVLARNGVIPLNSPVRYPRYNGGIERAIGEVKEALGETLPTPEHWNADRVRKYVQAVHTDLNVRPRRCLHGQSACHVYHEWPRHRFSKRERFETFEWIRNSVRAKLLETGKMDQRSARRAYRHAAETWLGCHGLIVVSTNPKSVTQLSGQE